MLRHLAISPAFVLIAVFAAAQDAPPGPVAKPLAEKKIADADRVLRVLVHLKHVAAENDPDAKKTGDALADLYLRRLAGFCVREKIPVKDFLVALGVGLDPSDFLRKHPLTRGPFRVFDSDEEREARNRVLGQPTLRKRADWLLHFALSAALTAAADADTAELLGVCKELQDSLGTSGFSFADLAADDAGIAFAVNLLARPERLADVAESFRGSDFLPDIGDLEEGLSFKEVVKKYGDPDGERFQAACRAIRERMAGQAVYRKWKM